MKQLTCELCGSIDLVKNEGVFICQNCGTKYSVEEAKKMMIEGTVEVQGTVRIDDSSKTENYYSMAINAYDAGNKQEAENYCNKIIEIKPNDYQAWLLKGKAAGWQSTLRNIRIEESVNCFNKAIDNAPEDAVEDVKSVASSEIASLSKSLVQLCCDNFEKWPSKKDYEEIRGSIFLVKKYALLLLNKCNVAPKNFYDEIATMMNIAACNAWKNKITVDYRHADHPGKVKYETFLERCNACISLVTDSINISDEDDANDIQRYKNLIIFETEKMNGGAYHYSNGGYSINYCLTAEGKQACVNKIMEYHNKIKALDPSYVIPAQPIPRSNGCYVATAVYGSYDCPQVWTLRRFRDYTLAETRRGRAFIKTYYAISPTLVKWFGHTNWFKRLWKKRLDKMVAQLQSKGVENTPYEDKNW